MPVYMIRAGEAGPVKIGYADDPQRRLTSLQVGHYEALRIVRLFEGGEAQEAALHCRFADLRVRGEWFSFSRAMLGDLGLTEIVTAEPEPNPTAPISRDRYQRLPPDTAGPRILDATVQRAADAAGGPTALASGLGIKMPSIYSWRRIPAERAAKIAEITGIPRHELRPDLWEPPAPQEAA